jgi:hypothetical protein
MKECTENEVEFYSKFSSAPDCFTPPPPQMHPSVHLLGDWLDIRTGLDVLLMFRLFLYWRRKRRKVYMANSASHNMGILSYCRAQWNLIRLDINPYLLYPLFSEYSMYLLRNLEYSLGHIMYLRLIDWLSIKKWEFSFVFWSFCWGVNVITDLPGF